MPFYIRTLVLATFVSLASSGASAAQSAQATVDATIEAASISTRDGQRDAHLKSPDFFDVEKFPTITFKSKKVTATGGDNFTVTGGLTIHGVTREVPLEVEDVAMSPGWIASSARATTPRRRRSSTRSPASTSSP